MARQIGVTGEGNQQDWIGVSTETKPTNLGPGSTFYEADSKNDFVFDGDNWWPA